MYKPKYDLLDRYEGKSNTFVQIFKYKDIVQKYDKLDIISIYNIDRNRYHYIVFDCQNDDNISIFNKKLYYGKSYDIFTNNEKFKDFNSLYCKGQYIVELIECKD